MKYYPLELNKNKNSNRIKIKRSKKKGKRSKRSKNIIDNSDNKFENILKIIIEYIIKMETILFLGNVAISIFKEPNKKSYIYDNTELELMSTNLSKDVYYIYNIILKYFIELNHVDSFSNDIIVEQYYPYFQFTDKKIIFKYKNQILMTIYGNNGICVPYINTILNDNNIKIGSFNLVFMINLIKFHQACTLKNKDMQDEQDYIMYKLLKYRNKYLDENKKTVLDNTVFEDFKVDCLGIPHDPMRNIMLMRQNRKLMPRSQIQPYDPQNNRDNYSTENYTFSNYSGNIINNPKDKIILKK
jgi:hypothetical protein